MIIRPMTPEDYDRFVELHNRVYPTRTRTVEEVQEAERTRNAKHKAGRWAAFVEDRLIGFAGYGQWTGEAHATWFQVNVVVDEPFRRQGVGASLYARLFEEMTQHVPKVLRADAYENLPPGLPFALGLGFKDVFREGPSHLDLDSFDAGLFAALLQRLEGEGIEFLSYGAYRECAVRRPDRRILRGRIGARRASGLRRSRRRGPTGPRKGHRDRGLRHSH